MGNASEASILAQILDPGSIFLPLECPITDLPEQGAETHDLPGHLRPLVLLYCDYLGRAKKINREEPAPGGSDGGIWFRALSEADAIMVFVQNALRTERKRSLRFRYDLYAGWKFVERSV